MPDPEILSRIPLFSDLDRSRLDRLAEIAVPRTADRGQVLFLEGARAEGFYAVVRGRVKIARSAPDGREAVLHIMGPGEVFGEVPMFKGGRFPANAVMVEKGRVLFFPRDAFVNLIRKDPDLAVNMLAALSVKLREFASRIESLMLKEAPQRLAAYLLHESGRREGDTVDLDITKGLLASLLGATRETLSRTLSRMGDVGLIEVQGRSIRLLDHEGLSRLASGEDRVQRGGD